MRWDHVRVGEIGLFRIDSGAAKTTQGRPKPVSPAGVRRATPAAVIPAAALMAYGVKPVIRARAEPGAGSSEAAHRSATGMPSFMSDAASIVAGACLRQSGQRDSDRHRQQTRYQSMLHAPEAYMRVHVTNPLNHERYCISIIPMVTESSAGGVRSPKSSPGVPHVRAARMLSDHIQWHQLTPRRKVNAAAGVISIVTAVMPFGLANTCAELEIAFWDHLGSYLLQISGPTKWRP
jgi:hypothetical protein